MAKEKFQVRGHMYVLYGVSAEVEADDKIDAEVQFRKAYLNGQAWCEPSIMKKPLVVDDIRKIKGAR